MADLLKRLEEIEAVAQARSWPSDAHAADEMLWLLKLTRALLESQGELASALLVNCRHENKPCPYCTDLIVRAEKVRKGEV